MKVWIVEGSTGEYEDRQQWIVKAFASEEQAEALQARLNQARLNNILKENQLHYYNVTERDDYRIPNELLDLDQNAEVDYTGASYSLYSIDVEE